MFTVLVYCYLNPALHVRVEARKVNVGKDGGVRLWARRRKCRQVDVLGLYMMGVQGGGMCGGQEVIHPSRQPLALTPSCFALVVEKWCR